MATATDFWLGLGDTAPLLQTVLRAPGSSSPLDLTGATVTMVIRPETQGAAARVVDVDIIGDPTQGSVQYEWVPEDSDTVRRWCIKFKVVLGSTKKLSVPNNKRGYFVEISPDP